MKNNCEVSFKCNGNFNCQYNENREEKLKVCEYYLVGHCTNIEAIHSKIKELSL